MTTEAELVLYSLTPDELDEAMRWVDMLDAHWRGLAARKELQTTGFSTDGPWHLMTAMRLAILAERAARGGADPWYLGMATDRHPAGKLLELYIRRCELNTIGELDPRLSPRGVLEQTCAGCGKPKPLDERFFDRTDGVWSVSCRDCDAPNVQRLADRLDGVSSAPGHVELPDFIPAHEANP